MFPLSRLPTGLLCSLHETPEIAKYVFDVLTQKRRFLPSNGSEVREDIVPGDQVVLGLHHLGVEVLGDVAAVLLAPVHHVGLVENVQLAVGYHLVNKGLST